MSVGEISDMVRAILSDLHRPEVEIVEYGVGRLRLVGLGSIDAHGFTGGCSPRKLVAAVQKALAGQDVVTA